MLMVTLADEIFPALSTAEPAAIWPAASALSVAGAVHVAIPDSVGWSWQLKVTVTAALFQPKLFAGGTALAAMVGGVLSRLMLIDVEAEFPARSVAVPLITWFAPSVLTVTDGGQDATPEVLSEQVKVTTTLELFQPKLSAAGAAEADITGGSLSTPMIEIVRLLPGLLRSCTSISLFNCRLTGLSIVAEFPLKSPGPSTWTPFSEITALEMPKF
jgi:hypothetical protein